MNALTETYIINLLDLINSNTKIHVTAIAYLQILLKPYGQALESAVTMESIIDWIPEVLPETLASLAFQQLDDNKSIEENKTMIITYLLTEIMEDVQSGTEITPWNIQNKIINDEELSQIFDVEYDLPVVVTVGPNQFTHLVTEELTLGLLLFSSLYSGINIYHLSMFNLSLIDLSFPLDGKYTFIVDNKKYKFNTIEFLQGFITGALWLSIDYHKLNLLVIDDEDNKFILDD